MFSVFQARLVMSTSQVKPTTRDAKDIYLDETYLDKNPTWHVEDSPWKAQQIQKMLRKHDIVVDTICEVGCGAGEILRQLSLERPKTMFFGYELSPQAFELCKARGSARVKFFLQNILEQDAHFDVLLCIDVFEHVEDYMGFLRSLKSKATYQVFHIPLDITVASVLRKTIVRARRSVGHLHYFTAETALATLRDCGYEVVDYFFTPSFNDLPAKTRNNNIARLPRKFLYAISPRLMVTLLGGCSLLVLTK